MALVTRSGTLGGWAVDGEGPSLSADAADDCSLANTPGFTAGPIGFVIGE